MSHISLIYMSISKEIQSIDTSISLNLVYRFVFEC